MTGLLETLLGLDRIRLADEGPVSLQFAAPPAPWIMLVGAVVAGIVVWFAYRLEPHPRPFRWTLAVLRFGAIMTALFICGQPMLVLRRNHVDPSYVAVLVDRSASMAARDAAPTLVDPPSREPLTRWQEAAGALTAPEGGMLGRLGERHRLGLWLFGKQAEPLAVLDVKDADHSKITRNLESVVPMGSGTDVSGSIVQVVHQTQGHRMAGLVVISDGRQTAADDIEEAVSAALARSIPVHVVAVGSTQPRRDLAVASIWAPEEVFLSDTVAVRYEIEAVGIDVPLSIVVELSDAARREVIATQTHQAVPLGPPAKGEFQYRPTAVGRRVLQVSVRPCAGELELENNFAQTSVTAHDEKIGVLYVEDMPRFEYRYLKNLLLRESGIESSCLLLGATSGFLQEGTLPIRRFPQSIEELRPYDVIVLGDVDPRGDWLTPVQQSLLVDFVSKQGGGLAFIAGERNMPQRLRQTPLEKLLPVEIDPHFHGRYEKALAEEFRIQLTSEGQSHPIFQLRDETLRPGDEMPSMPGLYWYARVLGPQPAASVLAVHPTAQSAGGPIPLAVLGRYGAGRTFYLGSDDLWRLRQDSGEIFYDTFWLQALHTLARARKLGEGRPWRLEADRGRCEVGEKIQVRLTASTDLPIGDLTTIAGQVRDAADELVGRLVLRSNGPATRVFEGEFRPRRPGTLALIAEPPAAGAPARRYARNVTVVAGDVEQRRLEADHEYLQRLARRTGGRFWRLTNDSAGAVSVDGLDLNALASVIPDRSIQIADDIEEPLWDKGVILLLFVTLIGTEWTMRRSAGMA
ncbi:MAG TPA: VWA domain-containing protein [Phycisphaerae bacterium]|nr:VWA domain-containing protein [Phycisphaerae bacterium]